MNNDLYFKALSKAVYGLLKIDKKGIVVNVRDPEINNLIHSVVLYRRPGFLGVDILHHTLEDYSIVEVHDKKEDAIISSTLGGEELIIED